ncbi:hypothetical protein G6F35_015403 [Rhizopus arrhizus]|nr:hypothetical protein G6F35_015403 [Rhizopus arrhizus]
MLSLSRLWPARARCNYRPCDSCINPEPSHDGKVNNAGRITTQLACRLTFPPWEGSSSRRRQTADAFGGLSMNLVVEGMTCGHCVRTVTQAIQALDPHAQVDVDLGSGVVKIEGLLAVEQAVEAIQRQG